MRRNNEDRTKTRRQQQSSVDPSSVLNFVAPTEHVDLPSMGVGYPEGHPLKDQETVEIKFMTTKDEDILTSKTLLKKGLAINKLIDNLLLDKTIRAADMLISDRNAIIIAARSSAYGHIYETKVKCPSCNSSQKMSFNLTDTQITQPDLGEDVEELENGNYLYETKYSKIKVEMRLLTGHDENILFKLMNSKDDNAILSTQMRLYIVSVNGHKQTNIIKHFVDNVPALEARALRKTYAKLTPNIQIKEDYECNSCGYEQEMEVPFNTDFFWPDR
tara:strand:+ start:9 stop:830 length:822 start_codon:yes stop_codon:yes gene_type:complete